MRRRAVVVALLGIGIATFWWLRTPSLVDIVLSRAASLDTAFPVGYSDLKWLSLRHGMTGSEVEAVLGRPFVKHEWAGGEVWRYSRSPADTHYWKRDIHFRGGVVVGFDSELYFD